MDPVTRIDTAVQSQVSDAVEAISRTPVDAVGSPGASGVPDGGVPGRERPFTFLGCDWALGPSTGSAGCGSEGTTAVLDVVCDIDVTPACDKHDQCSDPLGERSDKPFSEVLQCQVDFGREILAAGGDGLWGRIKAGAIAAVYVPVVTAVAVGQYIANRLLDAWDGVMGLGQRLFS